MPISAQPAGAFAPGIAAKFGASEQWNKASPALAELYSAAGRNYTQASAQTAQNQTSASAVSAGLEGRRIAQDKEIEAEMQARQFQAQVEMEKQQRAQQFELARQMIPITAAENQHNIAMTNGLSELDRQVKEGYMTPEQAAPHRYELVTGINAFQRRQQMQQSQHYEQQAKLETQRYEMGVKNQMQAEAAQSELAKRGVYSWYDTDPRTGETRFNVFNPKTGEIYNPHTAGGRGDGKPEKENPQMSLGSEWAQYTTKHGEFDYAAAAKQSELYAKHDFEDPKSKTARDWIKDNIEGIHAEWEKAKAKAQQPQALQQQPAPAQQQTVAPQPMAPEAQQMAQRYPGEVEQMAKKGLPPVIIESVVKDMAEVERIMSSKPYAQLSEREKGYLATLKEEIKRRMAAGSK